MKILDKPITFRGPYWDQFIFPAQGALIRRYYVYFENYMNVVRRDVFGYCGPYH